MKTILITGGTDGIGKGIVMNYLKKGYQVFAIGSSAVKGQKLIKEAQSIGKNDTLHYIQANLSLVKENLRVIKLVSEKINVLDALDYVLLL